jgi:hypothetical protein
MEGRTIFAPPFYTFSQVNRSATLSRSALANSGTGKIDAGSSIFAGGCCVCLEAWVSGEFPRRCIPWQAEFMACLERLLGSPFLMGVVL